MLALTFVAAARLALGARLGRSTGRLDGSGGQFRRSVSALGLGGSANGGFGAVRGAWSGLAGIGGRFFWVATSQARRVAAINDNDDSARHDAARISFMPCAVTTKVIQLTPWSSTELLSWPSDPPQSRVSRSSR